MDLSTLAIENPLMEAGPYQYLETDEIICTQSNKEINCHTPHMEVVLERTDFGPIALHLMVNMKVQICSN